jgi:hypothetical protein
MCPMSPRLLRPRASGLVATDPDARTYISAVQIADASSLEPAVQRAIDDFVKGCKADGIWTAIKASCILMGARTLSGALVPLVGSAPTNVNFVSGDYNRKTGITGDGSTKYLDTNRNNDADPQNNKHISVFVTDAVAGGSIMNSGGPDINGRSGIVFNQAAPNQSTAQTSLNNGNSFALAGNIANALASNSFMGLSRSASGSFVARFNSSNTTVSVASGTPNNGNISLLARLASPIDFYSPARIAFYSIGESLTLATLNTRVSALVTAIGAAIP